jgi:hypothetical protein
MQTRLQTLNRSIENRLLGAAFQGAVAGDFALGIGAAAFNIAAGSSQGIGTAVGTAIGTVLGLVGADYILRRQAQGLKFYQ